MAELNLSTSQAQYEDTPHVSGESGVLMLGVRNDTASSLAGTDGDKAPFQFDSSGNLRVTTSATLTLNLSYAAGNVDATTQRVTIATDDSNLSTINTNIGRYTKAEDTQHSAGDYGVPTLAVRNDTLASLVGADNDYTNLQVNSSGALYVITSGTGTGQYAEDAAHTSGDVGNFILSVRADSAATTAGTDGDYAALITDANGRLHVLDANSANILTAVQLIDDAVYADDADWTDSTSKHLLVGGLYQSSPQTITDGDVAPFNVTANGALHVSDAGSSLTVDTTGTSGLEVVQSVAGDLNCTEASASAIKTAVEIMDDWDESDRAKVNINLNSGVAVDIGAGNASTGTARVSISTDDVNLAAIKTAAELIDDAIYADDADWTDSTSKHMLVGGLYQSSPQSITDGDVGPLQVDSNGKLLVSGSLTVDSEFPAAAAITDNFATPTTTSVMAMGMWYDGSAWDMARGDATDGLLVNLGSNNDVTIPVGSQAMAASTPVTLATDDTQFGAVGAAADVDGNIHGQLRYIGEYVDNIPAVGSAASAASLPVVPANDIADATYIGDIKFGEELPAGTQLIGNVKISDGTETANVNASNQLEVNVNTASGLEVVQNTAADLNCTEASASAIKTAVEIMDDWDEVHDSAVGTDGVMTMLEAKDHDGSALPNAVGAEGDAVRPAGSLSGVQYTMPVSEDGSKYGTVRLNTGTIDAPSIDSYTHYAWNLTTGANQVLASSAASKQIWVYGYGFTCGDADGQTVSFQDEDDTAITGVMEFAQYGGMAVAPSGNFAMPLWKLATDKDLEVDITGGDVDGWIAYAVVSV